MQALRNTVDFRSAGGHLALVFVGLFVLASHASADETVDFKHEVLPILAYEIERRPFYVTEDGKGKPITELYE